MYELSVMCSNICDGAFNHDELVRMERETLAHYILELSRMDGGGVHFELLRHLRT
ncbi:G2/mitotic-specific cyclin-B3-like [Drosophila erecta]|uniref:G2/mitotic-specific cyclin-B3-like n=1 Tax=Drosophila erecta TaxID=7220 RepID=UPI000F05C530|nr:G2/mitotic-specific cyclin-B3-like [Drosophila erecta]